MSCFVWPCQVSSCSVLFRIVVFCYGLVLFVMCLVLSGFVLYCHALLLDCVDLAFYWHDLLVHCLVLSCIVLPCLGLGVFDIVLYCCVMLLVLSCIGLY